MLALKACHIIIHLLDAYNLLTSRVVPFWLMVLRFRYCDKNDNCKSNVEQSGAFATPYDFLVYICWIFWSNNNTQGDVGNEKRVL